MTEKLYRFRQAAKFGPKPANGNHKVYSLGVHKVDEVHESDPFFKHLVKHGLIVEAGEPAAVPVKSYADHQKKVAEKIKADAAAKAEEKKVEAPSDEVDESKDEEAPKYGKKRK